MTLTAATPVSFSAPPLAAPTAREEVRTAVLRIMTDIYPRSRPNERRREQRYPFPQLITLHPLALDGATMIDEPIVVVGKHISESGLGFFHPHPLPYRRVVASLPTPTGQWLALVVDLSWCRFTRQGWYESGGRFLQTVDSPLVPMGAAPSTAAT